MTPIDRWSTSVLDGVEALEGGLLPTFLAPLEHLEGRIPSHLPGAWVTLVGERLTFQLGLLAEFVTLELITSNMIGKYGDLTDLDITDAVTEIVNVISGVAKRAVVDQDPVLRTGMPMFLFGSMRLPSGVEQRLFRLRTDAGEILLVTVADAKEPM